ncbi:major capsid protein [Sigmofec virus UA08Rod_3874]|uniref:Major capsid protein n=1 Tax=Sigmofec virus UA08Rod_3874 TaxID=2929391 RepID=A0A976R739_9VIRU|nr:major capsid protein [Sigmofec virus UA08Rod_3874]
MKVNIGKDQHKKSLFPITLDSSTTHNFGECVPVFMHEAVPQSHVQVNIRDAVRFAPLSFPTFGKAFLKTYVYNHKISDLYPPFNDMLAKTPYTTYSQEQYVPSEVPNLPLWFLWMSVISNCTFTLYKFSNNYNEVEGYSTSLINYDKINYIGYRVGTANQVLDDSQVGLSLTYWILQSLYNGNTRFPQFNSIKSVLPYLSYLESSRNQRVQDIIWNNTGYNNISSFYVSGDSPDYVGELVSIASADFIVPLAGTVKNFMSYSENDVVFQEAEMIFGTNGESQNINGQICVAIRLNDSGKYLRKILMGLMYQVAPIDRPVSILPLYAYFKSWFETFAPKRFIKFEQTHFYKMINMCVQSGRSLQNVILSNNPNLPYVDFSAVIDDLLTTYYTKNTDYFSSQITGLINEYGAELTQSYIAESQNHGINPFVATASSYEDPNQVPKLNFSQDNLAHTQSQQNILNRLTQFVNRRSASGSRIAKLLQSVFGISPKEVDGNDYGFFVGSSSLDVNFSDVFSTAETAEGSLGEYAGKAMAYGNGDVFNINTDVHSIIVAFSTIVPRTQYVQGVSPLLSHIKSDDFYNPLFDGLTLLPTHRSNLYAGGIFDAYVDDEGSNSFGNLPIYTEYKTKINGVLSGDLSLRSTKSTYDSYTMDELIGGVDYSDLGDSEQMPNTQMQVYSAPTMQMMVNGTMWRYLGRWLWLGRFDRIFVNTKISPLSEAASLIAKMYNSSARNVSRTDDNLVVHHVVDMNINAPMIPLPGSWMTDDLYSLDPSGITTQIE